MAEPQPNPVPPAPSATLDQLPAIIAQIQAQQMGASGQDAPVVPLWRVRPKVTVVTKDAHRGVDDDLHHGRSFATDQPQPGEGPQTRDFAEAYWLDMDAEDRKAFAETAQKAGLWTPKQGADGLAAAWAKAVGSAAQYNSSRGKDQWISPFEAVDKLGTQHLADDDGSYDGYTHSTHSQVNIHQFTTDELYSEAVNVLQRELGRDPSDAELRAYTVAVNTAAAKSPTRTVSESKSGKYDPNTGEALDTETQSVTTGQFDPTKTITDMVRDDPERARYQAAATYFPAVMQALGAVVQ